MWDKVGSVDARLDVPTADGTGFVNLVWIPLTLTTDAEAMTGGACHFISFDHIGRYTDTWFPRTACTTRRD